MQKTVSLVLVVVLLTAMTVPVFAAVLDDTTVSPRYSYIQTCAASISIDESTGVSSCRAYCFAASGYTVEVECKLQRSIGTSWSTVKTWTKTGNGYANINQDWAVSSGYTYRVYATYRIRNASGTLLESETASRTYVYPKQ
jgi:hypothetical protein